MQNELMVDERDRKLKLESFYKYYERDSNQLVKEFKDDFRKFKNRTSKYGNK